MWPVQFRMCSNYQILDFKDSVTKKKKNVKYLINNCKILTSIEMIRFWLYWGKSYVLPKLISPASFYIVATRKFKIIHVAYVCFGQHCSKSPP